MPLFQVNREPADRVLRQFGALTVVAAGAFVWMATHRAAPAIGTAALLAATAVAWWSKPQRLKRPYLALSYATAPLGVVFGELLLLVMYFGVFLPIGLVFKLLGRDPLERAFRPDAPTYWTPKRAARDSASYLRQY